MCHRLVMVNLRTLDLHVSAWSMRYDLFWTKWTMAESSHLFHYQDQLMIHVGSYTHNSLVQFYHDTTPCFTMQMHDTTVICLFKLGALKHRSTKLWFICMYTCVCLYRFVLVKRDCSVLSTLDSQLGGRHHYDTSTVGGGTRTGRENLFGSRHLSWSYP